MFNMSQTWLTAEKTNPTAILGEFHSQIEVFFWLPVLLGAHLHVVTLFFVSPISLRKVMMNAFKIWRQYPLLMKEEREREERRNQLRRKVAEILPDFQTWQKRAKGDKKTDSVHCSLPPTETNPKGSPFQGCCGLTPAVYSAPRSHSPHTFFSPHCGGRGGASKCCKPLWLRTV